mgnify:CR=1 FL=1
MKLTDLLKEAKGDKEEYQKKFNAMLKKHGVDSIEDLSGEEKKKFFDAMDDAHTSDEEEGLEEGCCRACGMTESECGCGDK